MVDPGARRDTTETPGATTSGLVTPPTRACPDQGASVSSATLAVLWVSLAPAVNTQGSEPGMVTAPGPPLPAEATTVMPSAHAASTAPARGSIAAGSWVTSPKERFMTRMLCSGACTTTQPIPSMSRDRVVVPSRPATLTDTTVAPGATPM